MVCCLCAGQDTPRGRRCVARHAARASKRPYVTQALTTFSLEPLELYGDELTKFQQSESTKWGTVVRAAKLGPQQ